MVCKSQMLSIPEMMVLGCQYTKRPWLKINLTSLLSLLATIAYTYTIKECKHT